MVLHNPTIWSFLDHDHLRHWVRSPDTMHPTGTRLPNDEKLVEPRGMFVAEKRGISKGLQCILISCDDPGYLVDAATKGLEFSIAYKKVWRAIA